jgi:hypothetical protein
VEQAIAGAEAGDVMAARSNGPFIYAQCPQKLVNQYDKGIASATSALCQNLVEKVRRGGGESVFANTMSCPQEYLEEANNIIENREESRRTSLATAKAKELRDKLPTCVNVFDNPTSAEEGQVAECAAEFDESCQKECCYEFHNDIVEQVLKQNKGKVFNLDLWIAAQRCLAKKQESLNQMPGVSTVLQSVYNSKELFFNEVAIQKAKEWGATNRHVDISRCLDRCILSPEAREIIEAIEGGTGYKQRIANELGVLEKDIQVFPQTGSYLDYVKIRDRIINISIQIDEKRDVLATYASTLDKSLNWAKERFANKTIGIVEPVYENELKAVQPDMQQVYTPENLESAQDYLYALQSRFNYLKGRFSEDYVVFESKIIRLRNELESISVKINARTAELEEVQERVDMIVSLKEELCANYYNLKQLNEQISMQRKIDRISNTVSLYNRRQFAVAKLYIEEERKKLLKELRALGGRFVHKRDCEKEIEEEEDY